MSDEKIQTIKENRMKLEMAKKIVELLALVLSKTGANTEAISSLSTAATTRLSALDRKVEELGKRRDPDTLERKIEELSGQLVSLAQKSRQQQELLEKIWGRVSVPPPPPPPGAPAVPRPRAASPQPPAPAVSKEVTTPDVPAQAPPPSGVVAQPSPSPPPTRPPAVPRPGTHACGRVPLPPSPPKKTFAAAATPPPVGGWTVVQSKKATGARVSKKPSRPQPTVDQRSFELVHAKDIKLDQNEADNVVSAINRALHREGISDIRVESPVHGHLPTPGRHLPHLHTADPPAPRYSG